MTPDSLHILTTEPLIPLPVPARTRWQPLRLGLVELFHYDTEEFWFRDGHLLLAATTAPASPRSFRSRCLSCSTRT